MPSPTRLGSAASSTGLEGLRRSLPRTHCQRPTTAGRTGTPRRSAPAEPGRRAAVRRARACDREQSHQRPEPGCIHLGGHGVRPQPNNEADPQRPSWPPVMQLVGRPALAGVPGHDDGIGSGEHHPVQKLDDELAACEAASGPCFPTRSQPPPSRSTTRGSRRLSSSRRREEDGPEPAGHGGTIASVGLGLSAWRRQSRRRRARGPRFRDRSATGPERRCRDERWGGALSGGEPRPKEATGPATAPQPMGGAEGRCNRRCGGICISRGIWLPIRLQVTRVLLAWAVSCIIPSRAGNRRNPDQETHLRLWARKVQATHQRKQER